MASYTTIDNISDLTSSQVASAELLAFQPSRLADFTNWDNSAEAFGSESLEVTPLYRFGAKEGALYQIGSTSFFDPELRIYDSQGNAIQENNESDDGDGVILSSGNYNQDFIWNWFAPYTGTYYIDPGWHQHDSSYSFYSVTIYEDIDTAVSNDNTTSSAESHLSKYGVTVQQAKDFVLSHLNEPATIFNTAKQFGVTTVMLSEITGYPTSDITTYFASFGLDTVLLDTSVPDNSGVAGNHALLAQDMASFVNYIAYNNNTGALSTTALREQVLGAGILEDQYFSLFDPKNFKGSEDGVFTPEETGITSLGNIPATMENIESLFYGTAINTLRNLDFDEFLEISSFAQSFDPNDGVDLGGFPIGFREIAINAYNDPTNDPVFSNNETFAISVVGAAFSELQLLGNTDNASLFDGILYGF